MFDFNFDGKIDAFEMGLGCMMLDEIEKEERREQFESDLLCAGIDPLDFELMDDDEREEILLDNDLDIDDFDF